MAMQTVTTGEFFIKSRFRTNAKGPWPDVKEFLWRLQKPEEFRFIPRLSMIPRKSEEDDSVQLVEVSLEIEKWWPKVDESEIPPAEPAIEQPAGDAVQPAVTETSTPPPPPATTTTELPPAAVPPSSTDASPAVVTPPAPPSTPEPPTDPPSS